MEKKQVNKIALIFFILFIIIAVGFPVAIFITMNRNLEVVKLRTGTVRKTLNQQGKLIVITDLDTFKISSSNEVKAGFGNLKQDSVYLFSINKVGEVFKIDPANY